MSFRSSCDLDLADVGERIIALYDKVALREEMGDTISAAAKKDLLKSEFRDFTHIRLSLHVICLEEVGVSSQLSPVMFLSRD